MRAIAQIMAKPGTSAVRLVLALTVCLAGGLFAVNSYFSDSNYSMWGQMTYVLVAHFLPALLVGLLVPRYWWVSILVAWGGLLLASAAIFSSLLGGPAVSLETVSFYLGLLPAIVLLGGFVGSRLRKQQVDALKEER